ncbi:hypothetical protein [Zooshikella sp. RANM57]|uniref:hypothetical protein n=1 Tax=Zooshikella sp. RANM57 TaxID=3425863 RepID=UPI003D6EBFD1
MIFLKNKINFTLFFIIAIIIAIFYYSYYVKQVNFEEGLPSFKIMTNDGYSHPFLVSIQVSYSSKNSEEKMAYFEEILKSNQLLDIPLPKNTQNISTFTITVEHPVYKKESKKVLADIGKYKSGQNVEFRMISWSDVKVHDRNSFSEIENHFHRVRYAYLPKLGKQQFKIEMKPFARILNRLVGTASFSVDDHLRGLSESTRIDRRHELLNTEMYLETLIYDIEYFEVPKISPMVVK